MRVFKFLMFAGLILAVTGTAGAITLPTVSNGPVYIECYNRDQGTGYSATVDGTYSRTVPGGPFTGPGIITAFQDPTAGFLANEDTWGIFDFPTLAPGIKTGNNIIQDGTKTPYYVWDSAHNMTGDTALVGLVYGGWDKTVSIVAVPALPGGPTISIQVAQVTFELYAVDKANVDLAFGRYGPGYVPGDRTAYNRYNDWVEANDPKIKLLTATSTEFRFTGSQNLGNLTFEGQTLTYWDVDPTDLTSLWNPTWGNNVDPFIDDFGNQADIKLTFNIHAGTEAWSVNSDDEGGESYVIPEPMTCLGFVLSSFALRGYLRRRRVAQVV